MFVSLGDVVDRYTILLVKFAKTQDDKYAALATEFRKFIEQYEGRVDGGASLISDYIDRLKTLNFTLWDAEDRIRECIKSDWVTGIADTAKEIINLNDERCRIKSKLDSDFKEFIDDKQYAAYAAS